MILPVCLFVSHVHPWCLWRSQEVIGPLELELLMALSSHVGAGNGPSKRAADLATISPALRQKL